MYDVFLSHKVKVIAIHFPIPDQCSKVALKGRKETTNKNTKAFTSKQCKTSEEEADMHKPTLALLEVREADIPTPNTSGHKLGYNRQNAFIMEFVLTNFNMLQQEPQVKKKRIYTDRQTYSSERTARYTTHELKDALNMPNMRAETRIRRG